MDYIIVSTSKCLSQEWQLRLLKWSIDKTKQKGKVIFLASQDYNYVSESPKFTFPKVEVIHLQDWAKEWELKNNNWWGSIPNKYQSAKWLIENKQFNPEDRLLFIDSNMIFTTPIDLYPKFNEIIGQKWEQFQPVEGFPSHLNESITYPFAINFLTLQKIIKDWNEITPKIRKHSGKWRSDMWGLSYSLEKNNISISTIKNLSNYTTEDSSKSQNLPKLIPSPSRIESKTHEKLFFKQDYTFAPNQKIEVNKGKNLIDIILLSNIDQERTDYIYEAKWDFPYLFKHYVGDKGYLFFQPWSGGFNNIRMSFEQSMCLAYLTNRTLVLPPQYSMYLNEGKNTLSDFFETENLGVKHISFEELCSIKNIEPSLDKLKESSKVLNYDAVANVINFEKVPVPSKFLKNRKVINSEDLFDDPPIIYLDKNLLGSFHQTFYTKHETSLKQLIGKYLVYRNDLRDIAWQFINYIEDKSYYSIHVRRNDFQYKDLFISGEELYNNIKNIIPQGSKLYISTDSDDPNLFSTLKQNYQVIFYKDILSQLNVESFSNNWVPLIEQLICTRSIKFIGNENSTLSSHIYKLRCYMNDIEDKSYHLNTISSKPSSSDIFVFEKNHNTNWVREYKDIAFFDKSIIFVSIASYMDSQLFDTLKSLYEEVSNPHKVRVVVHLQDTEEQYQKILKLEYPNLEVIFTPNTETKGVVWARNRIKDKYNNEAYFLGIDSHSRFKKNWDLILINQYISIEEPKVILSTYPNHFDVPDFDKEYLNLPYNAPLVVDRFLSTKDTDNRLKMKNLPPLKDYQVVDTKWVSAGFVFTRGEWVKKVKIPEQMVFSGEEDAQTYLSYLKGWNIKLASEATIWHNYDDKDVNNIPYRPRNNHYSLKDNALEEINNLLYNQPHQRSVESLETYLGIKFHHPTKEPPKSTTSIKQDNFQITSYVISIPSLYHRLDESFWPSINSVKSINPTLFKGVEGSKEKLPTWWLSKKIGGNIHEKSYEPGVWGLVQSYLNLFEYIIEHKLDQPILILEDDSIIKEPKTFDQDLQNFIHNLPKDWEVGYISGYHGKNKKTVINPYVTKVSSVLQTNAVLYNGYKICKKLREFILNYKDREPIDVVYLYAYNNLNIPLYRSNKKLMYQGEYKSTAEKNPSIRGGYKPWEIL